MEDQIWIQFGMTSQTGSGIMQVVGFIDRSTGSVISRANIGSAIVTNVEFAA